MLRELQISNMLLITELHLDFQPGLNVLTGETGTGKSILLDCLGFVLGWRGRADLVRSGATHGDVTAIFDLPGDHAARAVLQEAGLPENDELILRRVNRKDGRKTAYVNDRRCSGEALRELSQHLVELHGQHDDKGLLNPKTHRALLDDFARLDLQPIRDAWRQLSHSQKALDSAKSAQAEADKDREYIAHALAELAQLDPKIGEDEALDSRRRLMRASEGISQDIAKAGQALGASAAEGALQDANRWLQGAAQNAGRHLDGALSALGRMMDDLADAQRGVEDCLDELAFNPMDLEQVEERLFAIRALARKHGVHPDQLPEFAGDLEAQLLGIENGAALIKTLGSQLDKSQADYDNLARELHRKRTEAARRLDKAMARELKPLRMERAIFTTVISDSNASAQGRDDVNFSVATNPGAPSGPINKIASGGELSRFLLALKVCLTSDVAGLTMIFDEIDRGIGGATADSVGRRLANLAKACQILVVTHSPQVAALAAHHWQVTKHVDAEETHSKVTMLHDDARVDEIARMLAGEKISDEARQAARVLLAG